MTTELIGFSLSAVMGILLGLLGGGGSILTVPIMVYLLAVPKDVAPSYSLFVVGVAASIGAVRYLQHKQIAPVAALVFGIPSTIAVFVNQHWVRPAIPLTFELAGLELSRGILLMLLFAVMMLLASWSMIRKRKRQSPSPIYPFNPEDFKAKTLNYPLIIVCGLGEGMFSGLVGAGGGFIIVPALVLIAHLPMKIAVGTSLLIMAVKSLLGFIGATQADLVVDWPILLPFTAIAVLGILVGAYFSKRISGAKLKQIFGWFVLAMGVFVVVKTILEV